MLRRIGLGYWQAFCTSDGWGVTKPENEQTKESIVSSLSRKDQYTYPLRFPKMDSCVGDVVRLEGKPTTKAALTAAEMNCRLERNQSLQDRHYEFLSEILPNRTTKSTDVVPPAKA